MLNCRTKFVINLCCDGNDDDYAPIGKKDFFAMAMSKINVENEQYAYSKGG